MGDFVGKCGGVFGGNVWDFMGEGFLWGNVVRGNVGGFVGKCRGFCGWGILWGNDMRGKCGGFCGEI